MSRLLYPDSGQSMIVNSELVLRGNVCIATHSNIKTIIVTVTHSIDPPHLQTSG